MLILLTFEALLMGITEPFNPTEADRLMVDGFANSFNATWPLEILAGIST